MESPLDSSDPQTPNNATMKWLQLSVVAIVFAIGFWQFAKADFDWRAVLEGANPWVFFFAMASLPVFGFPISACYIYAGIAFEPSVGIPACLGALIINMSVSYLLTQSVFKGPVERLVAKFGWKIPKVKGYNQFRLTFAIRTVPGPPFFFQNVTLGLAGIPFWTYLWISLLAQGSIAIGVILCSSALSKDPSSVGGIVALVIIGVLIVAKSIRWIVLRHRQIRSIEKFD